MKKALLIGKLNKIGKDITDCFSSLCQVQLCSSNKDVMAGMLHSSFPDLISVYLTGSTTAAKEIVSYLADECPGIPLLVIGSQADEAALFAAGYLSDNRVRFLAQPVDLDELSDCIQELIGSDTPTYTPVNEGSKATILLVDDSPALLRTMQTMLSPRYNVIFATSGTQAIATIARHRPDLILLDYEMPVCDGKMTLQLLRSSEETKDIPVVFLTGIANSKHVMDVLALRPQGYLLKPCAEDKVFKTIESVLRDHS